MDWTCWLALFGVMFFGAMLVRGISRARAEGNAAGLQGGEIGNAHGSKNAASSPLEGFGEELLSKELYKLRSRQSFYDGLIDGFGQRFTFWQSEALVSSWQRFFTNVTAAVSAQNEFTRKTGERLNIPLEKDKIASTLEADIAEERLRGARADRDKENLGKKPEAPKPESESPVSELVAKTRQWLEGEQERLKEAGVKEGDQEWELLLNKYDLRINRIFGVQ